MSTGTDLLSPQARAVIAQTCEYLSGVVVDVTIGNDDEKAGAVALGNEIQKRWSALEKERKEEKREWDEKARAVQAEFKPVLDALTEKKGLLGRAITLYDQEQERRRILAQKEADDRAAKEISKLENAASSAIDKATALTLEAKAIADAMRSASPDEYDALERKYGQLRRRIEYWQSKAEVKAAVAQTVVPEIVPETTSRVQGMRIQVEIIVAVTNAAEFVRWCLETKQVSTYLSVNEMIIKAAYKSSGGKTEFPGIKIVERAKTGFSGR